MSKKTVVVGLSGGVDSSVAALLLKNLGYNVIGLFMRNWEDLDGSCPASVDVEDVAAVCSQIDIPFYTVNFTKEYQELVFKKFLEDCQKGLTPNPDILCNREIKFHHFYKKAKEYGADYLATGHYCQIYKEEKKSYLAKAVDTNKDQSYFLYAISPNVLQDVLFPLGHLTKAEVRQIAKENHLSTHNKKDSTGICFIGKRNFTPFLQKYLPLSPGPIINSSGETIGSHIGLAYYTLGQRKGLNIGGPGEAWFVAKKDLLQNTLLVVQGEDHPLLYTQDIQAKELTWLTPLPPLPYTCQAKVRYRQPEQECVIEKMENNRLHIHFLHPQRAATPGQSIVFYDKNICLGGGIITDPTNF